MALDDLIPEDIDLIHAAKLMAPYLGPDIEVFSNSATEQQLVKKLSDAGVLMPQGRQAYSIACKVSGFLKSLSLWDGHSRHPVGVEIVDTDTNPLAHYPIFLEVSMPKILFEHNILGSAFLHAQASMEREGYEINPDFNEKAKSRLLQEAYSRMANGNRFNLLEAVNIGMDRQQRVYLRRL